MKYKLGKLPARPNAIQFKLRSYINENRLPIPPAQFGHASAFDRPWGMFANDSYGDCVWAGAAHETMLWHFSGKKKPAAFSDKSVLSDYARATGFNPRDPSTDNGTDMQEAASYRRKTGIVGARGGTRHKIDCYTAIKLGDYDELILATWLFDAVGVGLLYPQSADDQFNRGEPWDVVGRSKILGGHYVPVFDRNAHGRLVCVTWNQQQDMTREFWEKYCDEAVAYVSTDPLRYSRISAEGFKLDALRADLNSL